MIVRPWAEGGVECLAPAKLNVFLEVLGKRADGYHELETLMVVVDLYDTLRVIDDPGGAIALRCDDPSLPTGRENLVVRAAERLREASGIERGATIDLLKAIPAQAGLGGGSSDAAAALLALDRLWNLQTPPDRLDALAGEIGSDVAFFLHPPAALCRGRGERGGAGLAVEGVPLCPDLSSCWDQHRGGVSGPGPRLAAETGRAGAGGAVLWRSRAIGTLVVQPAPAGRRGVASGIAPGASGAGESWLVAGRALDERERLGLFRAMSRPARGPRRRAAAGAAWTRTCPGGHRRMVAQRDHHSS